MKSDFWFWAAMVFLFVFIIVGVLFVVGFGSNGDVSEEGEMLNTIGESCMFDSDCKLIYSSCNCVAVDVDDLKTEFESLNECDENECVLGNATARCENRICVNRTSRDDLYKAECRENSECVLKPKPYCCDDVIDYVDACYSVYGSGPENPVCAPDGSCPELLGLPIRSCVCVDGGCYGQVIENGLEE